MSFQIEPKQAESAPSKQVVPEGRPSYLRAKDETPEQFRGRMQREMAALREQIAHSNGVAADDSKQPPPPRPGYNAEVRKDIDEQLAKRQRPTPTVGISNRPGFGYDASIFAKGPTLDKQHAAVKSTSLPHGPGEQAFQPLPQEPKPSDDEIQQREVAVQAARGAAVAQTKKVTAAKEATELFGALPFFAPDDEVEQGAEERALTELSNAHGLYIPGGQDITTKTETEPESRDAYEQQLIREARLRGMPTLAVCGGSRALAKGFGAKEADLTKAEQKVHSKQGKVGVPSTAVPAHPIRLPDPHSLLGGAAPVTDATTTPKARANQISQVNSTHKKVVAHTKSDQDGTVLSPVEQLAPRGEHGTKEPALRVTATDDTGKPEGFEAPYGAPMIGVTSHPEALYGSNSSRAPFSEQGHGDAITWSDNLFKGFSQSMQAYAGRQELNTIIKQGPVTLKTVPPKPKKPSSDVTE